MAEKKKQSVTDFLRDFRSEVDVPEGVSDSELFNKLMSNPKARAKIQSTVELSQSEGKHGGKRGEPRGGFGQEWWKAVKEDLPTPSGIKGAMTESDPEKIKASNKQFVEGMRPDKMIMNMINPPGIGEALDKKNYGRAVGKATIPAIGLAGAATGPAESLLTRTEKAATAAEMEEAQAVGAGRLTARGERAQAAQQVAELANKPSRMILDEQVADIDKAMDHQYINAQRLTAGIAHAKNVIKKMKTAPDTKMLDVTTVREAVDKLDKAVTGNKTMDWTEARHQLQNLKAAAKSIKGDVANTMLGEVQDSLEDELNKAAKPVIGDTYETWVKDYNRYKNQVSYHQKAILGRTPTQMEARPRESMLKRYTKLGRSVADKKAIMDEQKIKSAIRAGEALHKDIKGRSRARIQPQTPPGQTPPIVPPPGGPQPPKGLGGAPPVSGGSGPQGGGPMSGLVDKVMGQQKPISSTQQALNDILKSMDRPQLPKNVVVGEDMGLKLTEPGTGPAKILQWPKKPQE